MTPLTESPQRQALREFGEEVCPVCGKPKQKHQSFCRRCYFTLSDEMRGKLYARFGSGYEENYQEAKDWLRTERKASSK